MAVAAPVLERKVDTEDTGYTNEVIRDTFMTAEEKHNLRISSNYAKLINPESTIRDIIVKDAPVQKTERIDFAPAYNALEEVREESPYLVENARADADIFRADSAVNRRVASVAVAEAPAQIEEEDNEDLRPTQTTIQYKTAGVIRTHEEGKIKTSQAKRTILTKRDKIIVAVALTVIIALFALIIVNSAIISGLHSEVSVLQTTLNTAESAFNQALSDTQEYFNDANLYQVVSEFANSKGMILR